MANPARFLIATIPAILLAAQVTAIAAAPKAVHAQVIPAAEPSSEAVERDSPVRSIPWPRPPAELARQYPRIRSVQLIALSDGHLVLSVARNDEIVPESGTRFGGTKEILWLVYLDRDGNPVRQVTTPPSRKAWPSHGSSDGRNGLLVVDPSGRRVLRVDDRGRRRWQRSLTPLAPDRPIALHALADGSFAVVGGAPGGFAKNPRWPDDPVKLFRYHIQYRKADGSVIWQRSFGPRRNTFGLKAVVPAPGGGWTVGNNQVIFGLDSKGRTRWRRAIAHGTFVLPSKEGGLVVVGETWDGETGDRVVNFFTLRIDSSGTEAWRLDKLFGDVTERMLVQRGSLPAPDGSVLVWIGRRLVAPPRPADSPDPSQSRVGRELLLTRIDGGGRLRRMGHIGAIPNSIASASTSARLPNGNLIIVGPGSSQCCPVNLDQDMWIRTLPFD